MWGIAAVLLALHGMLVWWVRIPAITTGNDDAVYLLLSRAIRSWRYVDLFYVGSPPHAQYPPLFPGFLALLGGVFGERLEVFLAANALLSVLALALFFDVARRRDATVALLALAVAATNPSLLTLAGGLRSEPLCMALTALALWLVARPAPSRATFTGAGAAAIAAALTRSAAVTLIGAIGFSWAVQRRWRPLAALILATTLTVGPWLAWTVFAPDQLAGRSYVADATHQRPASPPDSVVAPPPVLQDTPAVTQQVSPPAAGLLSTLAVRVRRNVPAYALAVMGVLAVPSIAGTSVDNLFWLLVVAGFGAVGLWGMRRWWMVGALTLAFHGALLVLWPYVLQRYLAPILPLAIIAVFSGAGAFAALIGSRFPRLRASSVLPAALALGVLAGAIPQTAARLSASRHCRSDRIEDRSGCYDPEEAAFFEATAFIASATPDSARFLAAKEGAFYYYAHRQVVPIYPVFAGAVEDLSGYLAANQAEYVFLSHLKIDEWAMVRPLLEICGETELVKSWGATTLLLRIGDRATPDPAACDAIKAYNLAPWGDREFRRESLP